MSEVVDLAEWRSRREPPPPPPLAVQIVVPGELAQWYRDRYPEYLLAEILEATLIHCRKLIRVFEPGGRAEDRA